MTFGPWLSAPWPSTTRCRPTIRWEEGDPKPSSPLRVKGRLSTAGPGQFYWHGTIEGDVAMECRRCLGDASAHVSEDAHLIFAEAGTEGVEDDPDVFLIDDRATELDLR
ncbi:MAG: YceD family protein, partial [Gemmatimonadaceae bacterium]